MRRIYFSVIVAILALSFGLALRAQLPQQVDTWALRGTSPDNRVGAAAVGLADGRTLIAGGVIDGTATDTVVLYNPADGSFSSAGQLLAARAGHTATLLEDGRVLVAGGTVNSVLSGDLEVFDPAAGASTLVASMAELRSGHAAARLSDGTVLIAGGTGTAGVLKSAEVFDPNTGTSSMVSTMQSARTGASATTLIDGRVLIAGGNDGNSDLVTAEIFYALTQAFEPTDTMLSVPRQGHAAVLLPNNGSVLIAGGSSNGEPKASADLFLPAQFPDPYSYGMGRFAATGTMATARSGAVGAAGLEGYALAIGGGSRDTEAYRFATIKTDKDDYAPGTKAIISGSGWQPGEVVTLLFQEDPAVHDDYVLTTTADAEGRIYYDEWAPEEHDLGVRFYLMANGQQSQRRAQTTFTDNINVTVDNPLSLDWHRTGEVLAVPNGFDVSLSGTYTCNTVGSPGNRCTSVTNLTITVDGLAGSKVVTGLANNATGASWGPVTLQFRSDGSGQFAIPADGRYDVTATLITNATNPAPTFTRQNHFGVDNANPVTTIQCNAGACVNPYNADVQVTLSADDGPGNASSGVTLTQYCVDETNSCEPGTSYDSGFSLVFASGITKYVRYRSTDDVGNVEATKSQMIQFQATTFDVTFDATPIADVPGTTTVLSVTIGAGPAVTVTRQELPKTFADLASDTNVSYSYVSPLAVAATKQYRWLSTSGTGSASGQTAQSGGPFSVTADSTVSATYKAQHLLTFNLSGVDPDYTGTVMNIDGSPIASTSFVGNSYTQWIDNLAAAPVVTWTDPLPTTETGKRYDFLNATAVAFTSPVSEPQTMTATYQKQWSLTFNLSGPDTDYTGLVVTIAGSPISSGAFTSNSYALWVNHNSPLTVAWADPLASTVTGKQYALVSATTPSTPVTVAQTLTAIYKTQWLLTFNLAGVDADYTGTVVTIGGVGVLSAPFLSNANSYSQWVDAGPAPGVAWAAPLGSGVTGKRYAFVSATAFTSPIASPQTITATYQKQWQLTWTQTGLAGTGGNTVVIVNGSPKTLASPLFSDWFNDGAPVSYAFQTPISTDPPSSTQFELANGGSLPSSPFNVSGAMTINGDYSTNVYSIQYLSPLDQSEGTSFRLNTGKNGRVIPVKVLLFKNGVAISDTSTVLMKVVGSNCEAGSGADPIDEYADAGVSNGNSNLFRFSAPHWIYNLDTRALGLATNACYRLDVYIGSTTGSTAIKASAMRWAIFKPVK